MIRALHKLARFVAWIMSPDKLEYGEAAPAAPPPDAATRRWLFAREQLPGPPRPSQDGPVVTGRWWRFFFAPEPLGTEPVASPTGPSRSFLRRLLALEPLSQTNPQVVRGSFLRRLFSRESLGTQARPQVVRGSFLGYLLSRDYLDTQAAPQDGRRSFLRWLFSSEAINSSQG